MTVYWVKYNFNISTSPSNGTDNGTSPDLYFMGYNLFSGAQGENDSQIVLGPPGRQPISQDKYDYYSSVPIAFTEQEPGGPFTYLLETMSLSDAYVVGTKPAPKTLSSPKLKQSPTITNYDGTSYSYQYSSYGWAKIEIPGPPDRFALAFNFKQGINADGSIKSGTLGYTLTDESTGQMVDGLERAATGDDAFPLASKQGSLDNPPTRISNNPNFRANGGLVFRINSFASNAKQRDVELHVGNPNPHTSLNPNPTNQVSINSESCIVVSAKTFLDPLQLELASIANEYGAGISSTSDLSNWINANVDCSLDCSDSLQQSTINVSNLGRDKFQFTLSRPLEKEVKVLYSVKDDTTGTMTTREAIINPTAVSMTGSSAPISIKSLSSSIRSTAGSIDPSLSNPKMGQALYKKTFNKALKRSSPSDQYTVTVQGYQVLHGTGSDWYFDSKKAGSTSIRNESLMFGSVTSITIGSGKPSSSISSAEIVDRSVDAGPVCVAAGSRFRGETREVAVQDLRVGDRVFTSSGTFRPVVWLGHRSIDCSRHPRPHEALPVRISAHAIGEDRPSRDLYVSPGHAICINVLGEVLIPAVALVNGSTIQQVEVDDVTYWHVELESHDVLLSENLPTESYLDMGNRSFFVEASIVDFAASPDAPVRTRRDFCRPFIDGGPLLEAVRLRLDARAKSLANKGFAGDLAPSGGLRRASAHRNACE